VPGRPDPAAPTRPCPAAPTRGHLYPEGYARRVELPAETLEDLQKRLRRAEGQIRGIQTMLAEGRDCRDVVTQLSAVIGALEQTGFKLVASGLTWCLANPDQASADGLGVDEVQRMFMKLT
jgi:DNA-binding FrmR family transcriptional regulator